MALQREAKTKMALVNGATLKQKVHGRTQVGIFEHSHIEESLCIVVQPGPEKKNPQQNIAKELKYVQRSS